MSNEETVQQSAASGPSAGSQLKAARESQGLAINDMAKAQHLRPSVIQAIENGDYQQIDTELFLKGYVRAYANHVGLDPKVVLSQLDQELEPLRREKEQAHQASPLVTIEQKKRRKKRIARMILILLFLSLAGFIGYRVFLQGATLESLTSIGQSESGVAAEGEGDRLTADDAGSAPPAPSADEEDDSGTVPVEPAPEPEALVESVQPESESQVEATETNSPEPAEPTVEAAVEEAVTEPEPELEIQQAPDVSPAPVSPSTTEIAATPGNLTAVFKADCWIRVTDANGDLLVSALRRSGQSLDVTGTPPLKVVIGAVDAVDSMSFEGQTLDLGSYRVVNNRAEFSLN